MDFNCFCLGIPAPETVPPRMLSPFISVSGNTALWKSSAEPKAAVWNRYIFFTIAEISFEPAVISLANVAFFNTFIRRVAVPTLSDRYPTLYMSSLAVLPHSAASTMGSLPPDSTAHCLPSCDTFSADRRSSWILSVIYKMRL